MNHYFKELDVIVSVLVRRMLQLDPEANYTVKILLWDDNTHHIECRSMTRNDNPNHRIYNIIPNDKEVVRIFTWYKDELSYEEKLEERKFGTS